MGTSSPEIPIRVFHIDDHPVLQRCLQRALLSFRDIAVIGTATSAVEGVGAVVATQPDVVLLDLGLPDRAAQEVLVALTALRPQPRVLVYSGYDDEFHVGAAIRAGALGYLSKSARPTELVDAIRRVALGEPFLGADLTAAVIGVFRQPAHEPAFASLSRRELDVLYEIAEGASVTVAAARLGVSRKTVEAHRASLYRKLGCSSPQELARVALRNAFVER